MCAWQPSDSRSSQIWTRLGEWIIWFGFCCTYIQVKSSLLLRARHVFCGWANFSVKTYHNVTYIQNFFAHTKTHRDANRVLRYKTSKWSVLWQDQEEEFVNLAIIIISLRRNTFPSQILSLVEGLGACDSDSAVCSIVVPRKVKFSWKGCVMLAHSQALDSWNFSRSFFTSKP